MPPSNMRNTTEAAGFARKMLDVNFEHPGVKCQDNRECLDCSHKNELGAQKDLRFVIEIWQSSVDGQSQRNK